MGSTYRLEGASSLSGTAQLEGREAEGWTTLRCELCTCAPGPRAGRGAGAVLCCQGHLAGVTNCRTSGCRGAAVTLVAMQNAVRRQGDCRRSQYAL